MPQTYDSIKAHNEWQAFVNAIQVVIEEPYPGQFTYHFTHSAFGKDNPFRGYFTSQEAAMASAQEVIKLKWPEPYVE